MASKVITACAAAAPSMGKIGYMVVNLGDVAAFSPARYDKPRSQKGLRVQGPGVRTGFFGGGWSLGGPYYKARVPTVASAAVTFQSATILGGRTVSDRTGTQSAPLWI